jgi:chondroitin 4-sulfotransferase 11
MNKMRVLNNIRKVIMYIPQNILRFLFKLFFNKEYSKIESLKKLTVKVENQYSLKGFIDNKCIFIHIPKAGGISLAISLFGNLGFGHSEAYKYLLVFNKKEFNEYFKFTVVRNPWDRLVSAYLFLKAGGYNQKDKEWFDEHLSRYKDFQHFVMEWVNENNVFRGIHFKPQYEFITIKNKIVIDKIYKMENLDEVEVDFREKLNKDIKIIHKNKTPLRSKGYRQHYNETTKEIVRRVYRKDIILLNYQF